MTSAWLAPVGVALFGFVATLIAIPAIKNRALRLGIVDHPGGSKQHFGVVPLLGGMGIMLPLLWVLLSVHCVNALGEELFEWPKNVPVLSLLLGTAWIRMLSTIDDMYSIALPEFLGQLSRGTQFEVRGVYSKEIAIQGGASPSTAAATPGQATRWAIPVQRRSNIWIVELN